MSSARLPRLPTRFIGRRGALREVAALLDAGPLVTVVGASGIGKTRFAIELAHQRPEPTFLIDLTEQRDEEGLCNAVAAALGAACRASAEALVEPLRRRGQSLFLLDNVEQLVGRGAEVVGTWIAGCPEARFLLTSRERLRIHGEVVYELRPLALPEEDMPLEAEAMQLWIDCRRRLESDYQPSNDELPLVVEILRQLDGIPLAIELAAARASVLGSREILDRLGRRFDLLARGPRDRSARQATMQGAIDWSWELLTPWEQAALAQCSVFRGGFSAEAAEAIIDLSAFPDAPPTLDVLQALRDKSLLHALPGTSPLRLGLYSSIRDYAADRLAELGGERDLTARARAYFVPLARKLARGVDEKDGPSALDRLASEADNLIGVASRALEDGDASAVAAAVACLAAIDVVLWTRGPVGAHRELLDRAVRAAEGLDLPAVLAEALEVRGLTLGSMGRHERGRQDLERAVELARAAGDDDTLSRVITSLTWILVRGRALDEIDALLAEALPIARRVGHRLREAQIIGTLGVVAKERRDYDLAGRLARQALAILREIDSHRFAAVEEVRLAMLDLERGRLVAARDHARSALEVHRRFGSRYVEGVVLLVLGVAELADGRLDEARQVFDEALVVQRYMGEPRSLGACLAYRGIADLEAGDPDAALGRAAEACEILEAAAEHRQHATFRAFLAAIELGRGNRARAGLHLERCAAVLAEHDDPKARAVVEVIDRVVRGEPEGPADADAIEAVDLRIARRLSQRLRGSDQTAEEALVVESRGRWFRPPAGEPIDCSRRGAMRRLLVRLAHQRIHSPGTPLPIDALLASGWPDERMSPESARNRLHVTLNRLRDLGLRELLRSDVDGYWLDPAVPTRFTTDPGPAGEA